MPQITQAAELPKAPVEPIQAQAPEQTPVKQDDLAPKFAALAKKEKWIRGMQAEIQKQKEDLKTQETKYKTDFVDKKRIKEDFLQVAFEAGLTPDQIANMLLTQSGGAPAVDPAIREMRSEIQALRDELAQTKNTVSEKEKTQYDQAVSQIKWDAEQLLEKNKSDFETLSLRPDASDLVTKYIEETYKDEGRVLTVQDAATFIENELLEQAIAMAKLSKVQTKLGLTPVTPDEKPQQTQQQQPIKTLTNGMVPSSKPLNAKDRRERAILAFQGKL